MSNTKTTNPTERIINEKEGFDPIKEQTKLVLEMVRDHLEWNIESREDFVKHLKKKNDLKFLLHEEKELIELKLLNDFVINLQRDMEVV